MIKRDARGCQIEQKIGRGGVRRRRRRGDESAENQPDLSSLGTSGNLRA